jgi:NAD(P)H-nitrite reductase large subunit
MQGLYLLPESWYDEHRITAWLNTVATGIDMATRQVRLGTGDMLGYDRLVLAMGSASTIPAVDGFGLPGSFVMREAADAMAIRGYVQQHGARNAVVAGAGLLGLEAAHSLNELGLHVTVLDRGERLLAKLVDSRCSELVHAHFSELGIEVRYRAEAASLQGGERTRALLLKDGTSLPCEVLLAAVGIRPNVELAATAGLAVGRGVLVDDHMRTSVPDVYAVGDVAEHSGAVPGLWPIAAKQAEVAAVNALGGDERLIAEPAATILKGVGLELAVVGRAEPRPGEQVVVTEDASQPSYRRLVLADGQVVGAVVLGHHPQDLTAATAAVKKQLILGDEARAAVQAGDWSVLTGRPAPAGTVATAAAVPA